MNRKNYFSLVIILLIGFVWIKVFATIRVWNTPQGVINNDVISYYAYLPATFIYKDVTLKFWNDPEFPYHTKIWPEKAPNGGLVIKTSMGLAFLYAPFFAGAHVYAKVFNYSAEGFSKPYEIALLLSSIFFGVTGLVYLRKILVIHFSDGLTALCIMAIALGTNLFNYVTTEACMSHVYSFCLINIFIWTVYQWHKNPTVKPSIFIGLLGGLIALIRPTNILIFVIFFFFDIKSLKDIKNKFIFMWKKKWLVMLIGALVFIVWVPQFLYWKTVTGNWTFFSYVGERFFFDHPHIVDGLFSYRKGWLLYTPIMIFAVIGILLLPKKAPELFTGTIFFFCFSTYIIFSWWCWWYGGGFGNRAFVDMYGLMAIPLASFFSLTGGRVFWRKLSGTLVVMVLIAFQLFQSYQYRTGSVHWDSMNKEAYWASFLESYPPKGWYYLLTKPDYDAARKYGREDQAK